MMWPRIVVGYSIATNPELILLASMSAPRSSSVDVRLKALFVLLTSSTFLTDSPVSSINVEHLKKYSNWGYNLYD